MKTSDFINDLLKGPEKNHFNKILKKYGFLFVENEIGEEGYYLEYKGWDKFWLGGDNLACLLEWMFERIEGEAKVSAKNNCRENFKKNLLKMLD